MTKIIESLSEVSDRYDAYFVDLWGCVHDGVKAMPEAVAALQKVRANGAKVVLVTNSPRPRAQVETQIAGFGVPRDAWDVIATSGDSARVGLFSGVVGEKVYFIGSEEEHTFLEAPHVLEHPLNIETVSVEEAEGIVCTGPFDPMADPEVLRPQLEIAVKRGLKLLCANPDIVVDRGEYREWCAGAIAKLYTEMGGESLYFGKPHKAIYELAHMRLGEIHSDADNARILAIGDGIKTDVLGAINLGIDCIFISGGLAAEETKTDRQPEPDALESYLKAESLDPTFTIGKLR